MDMIWLGTFRHVGFPALRLKQLPLPTAVVELSHVAFGQHPSLWRGTTQELSLRTKGLMIGLEKNETSSFSSQHSLPISIVHFQPAWLVQ